MHGPQSPPKATNDGNRCNWFSCTQPRAIPWCVAGCHSTTEKRRPGGPERVSSPKTSGTTQESSANQAKHLGRGWGLSCVVATSTSLRNKHQATQEAPAYTTSTALRMYTCSPPEGRHNQPCPPQASKVEQDRSPKVNGVELASRAAVELHHTEDSKPNGPTTHACSMTRTTQLPGCKSVCSRQSGAAAETRHHTTHAH